MSTYNLNVHRGVISTFPVTSTRRGTLTATKQNGIDSIAISDMEHDDHMAMQMEVSYNHLKCSNSADLPST